MRRRVSFYLRFVVGTVRLIVVVIIVVHTDQGQKLVKSSLSFLSDVLQCARSATVAAVAAAAVVVVEYGGCQNATERFGIGIGTVVVPQQTLLCQIGPDWIGQQVRHGCSTVRMPQRALSTIRW